jgi:hypothetical protein
MLTLPISRLNQSSPVCLNSRGNGGNGIVGFLILLYLFGWVAVFILATGMTILELCRFGFAKNGRLDRLFLSAGLLLLGYIWQQSVADYNFGRTLGTIVTEDGQRVARIRTFGAHSHFLEIDSSPDPFKIHLFGLPDKAFWMRNDSAIGIEYGSRSKDIVEVDLIIKGSLVGEGLTEDELKKLDSQGNLSPSDTVEFETSQQHAQRLGLLWTKE